MFCLNKTFKVALSRLLLWILINLGVWINFLPSFLLSLLPGVRTPSFVAELITCMVKLNLDFSTLRCNWKPLLTLTAAFRAIEVVPSTQSSVTYLGGYVATDLMQISCWSMIHTLIGTFRIYWKERWNAAWWLSFCAQTLSLHLWRSFEVWSALKTCLFTWILA